MTLDYRLGRLVRTFAATRGDGRDFERLRGATSHGEHPPLAEVAAAGDVIAGMSSRAYYKALDLEGFRLLSVDFRGGLGIHVFGRLSDAVIVLLVVRDGLVVDAETKCRRVSGGNKTSIGALLSTPDGWITKIHFKCVNLTRSKIALLSAERQPISHWWHRPHPDTVGVPETMDQLLVPDWERLLPLDEEPEDYAAAQAEMRAAGVARLEGLPTEWKFALDTGLERTYADARALMRGRS